MCRLTKSIAKSNYGSVGSRQALDLDRSAIYERDSAGQPVRVTHTWRRPDFPAFPRNFDPVKFFQVTVDWVMAGNPITFSRPTEIPPELEDARRFVERWGPKASAVIPMWGGGRVIGAASFGKFRSARQWPPELLDHLALSVRLFGSAIERKQSEMAIRAVRTELRVASRRNVMSELVASLSHEINQPLGAISEQSRRRRAPVEPGQSAAGNGSGSGQQRY